MIVAAALYFKTLKPVVWFGLKVWLYEESSQRGFEDTEYFGKKNKGIQDILFLG